MRLCRLAGVRNSVPPGAPNTSQQILTSNFFHPSVSTVLQRNTTIKESNMQHYEDYAACDDEMQELKAKYLSGEAIKDAYKCRIRGQSIIFTIFKAQRQNVLEQVIIDQIQRYEKQSHDLRKEQRARVVEQRKLVDRHTLENESDMNNLNAQMLGFIYSADGSFKNLVLEKDHLLKTLENKVTEAKKQASQAELEKTNLRKECDGLKIDIVSKSDDISRLKKENMELTKETNEEHGGDSDRPSSRPFWCFVSALLVSGFFLGFFTARRVASRGHSPPKTPPPAKEHSESANTKHVNKAWINYNN
eukprot:GEMP01006474.1.p1 GENE.GEMP01006474.1~~GEMP01006474.1.p1  ORF type:complete len:304 (+),score=48.54 GEMP01006474.1:25-936(+)